MFKHNSPKCNDPKNTKILNPRVLPSSEIYNTIPGTETDGGTNVKAETGQNKSSSQEIVVGPKTSNPSNLDLNQNTGLKYVNMDGKCLQILKLFPFPLNQKWNRSLGWITLKLFSYSKKGWSLENLKQAKVS